MTFSRRTHLVRAALERSAGMEYSYPRNDCWAVVERVVRAIDASVVLPPRPDGDQAAAYETIRSAGGLEAYMESVWAKTRGLVFGPDEVRAGDWWTLADDDHLLGAYVGVFDGSLVPVSWCEDGVLNHMTRWPDRIWTYGSD